VTCPPRMKPVCVFITAVPITKLGEAQREINMCVCIPVYVNTGIYVRSDKRQKHIPCTLPIGSIIGKETEAAS